MITDQMERWSGTFGQEYTDRNIFSAQELDDLYQKNYGITRTELNTQFLAGIDPAARILEVGSNVGNQLVCLQQGGFHNLYGIELQRYAVEVSKTRTQGINIIEGSAFDIPYKDDYFDLVFTSGVLIHINPSDINRAMSEIYRCAGEYIWGFEYYAPEYTEIIYRGQHNLLWKADFVKLYLELFDDLKLVRHEKVQYLENDNVDAMFLLRKS